MEGEEEGLRMNCQEVETIIIDLGRNGVLEVEARDRALTHVRECRRCGERLEEERMLSEGLAVWAAASAEEQAPARVEEKLRAAFRLRREAAAEPMRRGRGWLKITAAGSIAAGVLLFKLWTPAPPRPPEVVTLKPPVAPEPVGRLAVDLPRKPVASKRQANRLPHHHRAPAQLEVGTEFFPVAQLDDWTPFDGGRLVRVELPKSALGVFGLPVDEERGPDRVQADVMLSNDGLLRAIRFVH
jgi:hypothetical protein